MASQAVSFPTTESALHLFVRVAYVSSFPQQNHLYQKGIQAFKAAYTHTHTHTHNYNVCSESFLYLPFLIMVFNFLITFFVGL